MPSVISARPNVEEEIANIVRSRPTGIRGRHRIDGTPTRARSETPGCPLAPRNVDIVLEHFGFGDTLLPTLDILATEHKLGTRERVRQIIKANYDDLVAGRQFPAAQAVASALAEKEIWIESDFLELIQERGLIGPIDTTEALLLYVQNQGLARDYIVVLPDLKRVTRGKYRDHDERFIVHAARLPSLRQALDAAEAAYRSDGLASLEHVVARVPDADVSTLRNLLRCHRFVWSQEIDGRLWFAFNDRASSARTCAAKIFGVVSSCRVDILSQLIANGLTRRTAVYEYPHAAVLEAWIRKSPDFAINDGIASYLGETQPPDGLEIQQAAALTGKPGRLYTEILSGFSNVEPVRELNESLESFVIQERRPESLVEVADVEQRKPRSL